MRESKGHKFGLISRLNHWTTAIVFLGMIIFGFYLEFGEIERSAKGPLMGIHKSIGVLFLGFALWRVGWRLMQGFPKDISAMPLWQSVSSKAVHYLLLLSILAMPLSGFLMSLYGGRSINVFNWFTIPAQNKIEMISSISHSVHMYAPYAITAIITLHIAAALKHHFIDKDATLKRMTVGSIK